MRGAGDLPQPEIVAVGLTVIDGAQQQDIRFGLEVEYRHVQIFPYAYTLWRRDIGFRLLGKGRAAVPAAVHHVAVEGVVKGVDGIDVGHQAPGGLGLPQCDHLLHLKAFQQVDIGRFPQSLCRLGKHVVGEAVARVFQRAVARRIHGLEVQRCHRCARRALYADTLCRYTDPHMPPAQHFHMPGTVGGAGVKARGNVQPFHQHGAAEIRRINRAIDHYPGAVVGAACGLGLPGAVTGQFVQVAERGRRAREEILALLVADVSQIKCGGEQEQVAFIRRVGHFGLSNRQVVWLYRRWWLRRCRHAIAAIAATDEK